MTEEFKNKILKEKEEDRIKADAIKKRENGIAVARLISFLAAFVLTYLGLVNGNYLLPAGIVLFVAFFILIRISDKEAEEKKHLLARTAVLSRHLFRLDDRWKTIEEDGKDYLQDDDTLSMDLDLLGKGSLFQLLNLGHTSLGKSIFAETVSLKKNHIEERKDRFDAAKELSENPDLLVDFEAASETIHLREEEKKKAEEERKNTLETEEMEEESKDDSSKEEALKKDTSKEEALQEDTSKEDGKGFPFFYFLLMILIPVANVYAILANLLGAKSMAIPFAVFAVSFILTSSMSANLAKYEYELKAYGPSTGDFQKLLQLIANGDFKSRLLRDMKEEISGNQGMMKKMKAMQRINQFDALTYNPVLHLILAGFLGYDFYIAYAAFKWQKKSGKVFEEALVLIGRFEELMSLSEIFLIRDVTEAEILPGTEMKVVAENMRHPMIQTSAVVGNVATVKKALTIITGSNMSGKTTYLRTLALNLVLAYIGTGVTADSFKAPVMRIFTSMRVHDDVANGISTFYAEILRIKSMAEYIEERKQSGDLPAFCLIDEIFKGTNSADRIVGAKEALQKLSVDNNMVLVSTHDFELCNITTKNNDKADNYHFSEYYDENELKFSYKIQNGPCTTTNARAILRLAGLMND